MKIATWNVNSLRVRLEQVADWITREQPDVLALQETKLRDQDFPVDTFTDLGYAVSFSGQRTYNGVALAYRNSANDVVTGLAEFDDEQKRVIAATINSVRIYNLYVPNGQRVDSEKYQYKLTWLSALRSQLATELDEHERCVLLGDFNIAPRDIDVHDPELWRGKVLCSGPERDALDALLELGMTDVFRELNGNETAYSWWDYRAAAFRRNRGLRIDLILASAAMTGHCTECWIDVEPRRLERPSDHTPVVAEFAI